MGEEKFPRIERPDLNTVFAIQYSPPKSAQYFADQVKTGRQRAEDDETDAILRQRGLRWDAANLGSLLVSGNDCLPAPQRYHGRVLGARMAHSDVKRVRPVMIHEIGFPAGYFGGNANAALGLLGAGAMSGKVEDAGASRRDFLRASLVAAGLGAAVTSRAYAGPQAADWENSDFVRALAAVRAQSLIGMTEHVGGIRKRSQGKPFTWAVVAPTAYEPHLSTFLQNDEARGEALAEHAEGIANAGGRDPFQFRRVWVYVPSGRYDKVKEIQYFSPEQSPLTADTGFAFVDKWPKKKE